MAVIMKGQTNFMAHGAFWLVMMTSLVSLTLTFSVTDSRYIGDTDARYIGTDARYIGDKKPQRDVSSNTMPALITRRDDARLGNWLMTRFQKRCCASCTDDCDQCGLCGR